jgi:hypothetical protein
MSYFIVEIPDNDDPNDPTSPQELALAIQNRLTDVVLDNGDTVYFNYVKVHAVTDDDTSYVLLQEGGSSDSIYVHAHETEEDAEADRYSCRDDGSYRTTPVMAVPPVLAALGEVFYGFLDDFCRLANDMGFPEGDNPHEDEDAGVLEDEGGLA